MFHLNRFATFAPAKQNNMKAYFNYDMVPLNYIHCLNSACTQGESCLRHLVALHVPQNLKSVVAVNPSNYPADAGNCPYFRSTVKRRYAWGISTLFDNIPYKKALMLKRMVRDIYPQTTYYRILHAERGFSPAEQERIAGLFLRAGITETPVFDSYLEEYDWDECHVPKARTTL